MSEHFFKKKIDFKILDDIRFTAEFIDIWLFVERKFKIFIPTYIKNVLKYYGYEDCHSIATIEENDLEYFTTEVRNGGITNFFSKTGTENALQGSNKSEENFEFCRGHQKLIMAIVKLVKENLNENGVDAFSASFSVKLPKQKNNLNIAAKTTSNSRNEMKDMSTSTSKESELTLEFTRKDSKDFFHKDLINLQATLLKQTIRSLLTHSSDMYEENMEFIGTKICNGLVYITTEKRKTLYSAENKCPYCAESVAVSHILNESLWNTSNYDSHLAIFHNRSNENFEKSNKIVINKLIPKTCDFTGDSNQDAKVKAILKVPIILNSICLPSLLPIVAYSDCDTNTEDEECKSINFFGMSDKFNEHKIIGQKNHTFVDDADNAVKTFWTRILAETLLENDDKTDNDIVAKEGNYVICSVTKESTIKWPNYVPIAMHFVGQILRVNGLVNDEIELQILKRNHASKFIFVCIKKEGIQVISVKNIVKILEAPTRNRRNKLGFKDKSLLDYNI